MRTVKIADKEIAYELKRTETRGIRLLYRAENDPPLIVHAGRFIPEWKIRDFLAQNEGWILGHMNRTVQGFFLLGQPYRTMILKGTKNSFTIRKDSVLFTMKDPEDDDVLEALVKHLWKTVLEEYTENHREEYERVTGHTGTEYQYRIMHTRYGSCSPKKNRIHLNTQLACYAPEIIDSIVYHEYAHFRVLNHSARFYKVLEGYDPAYRKNHAKMRQTAFVNPRTCVRTNLSTEAET
ncbi:MAG: DUF45 domain-containing protein [Erysipelotrichales bacterium]|nr:DUF45 domain-containing protein [Erysipelotrichales bacterium]